MKTICRESTAWAGHLTNQVRDALRGTGEEGLEGSGGFLRPLWSNVLVSSFPGQSSNTHGLPALLNREFCGRCLVVNLSGCTYDTSQFQDPVMDVIMSGCVPPLDVLMRLCVSVHRWLSSDAERVLVTHGGKTVGKPWASACAFGSVAVFLACYMSWSGLAENPKDGLLNVSNALETDIEEIELWPSHRRCVKYFELLQKGLMDGIGRPWMKLTCLVFVGMGGDGLPRVVEIWQQDRLLFRADVDCPDLEDAMFNVDTCCGGDIAIRVFCRRHSKTMAEGPAELELQVCFHTAFVADGFIRFPVHEIDRVCEETVEDVAIDAFFVPTSSKHEDVGVDGSTDAMAAVVQGQICQESHVNAPFSGDGTVLQNSGDQLNPALDSSLFQEHDDGIIPVQSSNFVFLPEDMDSFFGD
mmetsp:Transcript_75802/g.149856  ORF Transcript_75802/g.149856 Transcript_75802/m.149856 type:complete len:412 (+) Transcript_75802:149-1384(+)